MSETIKADIRQHFVASAEVMARTGEMYAEQIFEVAVRVAASLRAGGKVMTCGNGGSASDAEHIATEFVSRYRRERQPLPAMALTGCPATLTAIGNDYGFEQLFARQVTAHGSPGDVLFAISTSGASPNVLAAVRTAKLAGLVTVGFTGARAGGLEESAEVVFAVPSAVTAHIQQCHITIAHAICEAVDEILAGV